MSFFAAAPAFRRLATPWRRGTLLVATAGLLAGTGACGPDSPVRRVFADDPVVSRWTTDSLFLNDNPEVLFRVVPDAGGAFVVPIGTVGRDGLRTLKLSARGWRRVDADFMHAGKSLTPYRNGRAAEPMRMFRGMWQPGAPPLDSVNCPVVIPMARSIVTGTGGERSFGYLATNGRRPPLKYTATMDQGAIEQALENIGTLVAPSSGIAPGQLSRYERRVVQIPSGINGGSSLLVEYNDPEPLPDSLKAFGERPRQFIVVLDKGTYGFRPTYSFSTVGSRQTPPRLQFLDYLDTDDDGVPELFFGLLERERAPLYTLVLRYNNDAWRESYRYFGSRCDF